MPPTNEVRERERVRRMLRRIRTGDIVRATVHASTTSQGMVGTVIDPEPFSADGQRRIKVNWDNGVEVNVLPASIAIEGGH